MKLKDYIEAHKVLVSAGATLANLDMEEDVARVQAIAERVKAAGAALAWDALATDEEPSAARIETLTRSEAAQLAGTTTGNLQQGASRGSAPKPVRKGSPGSPAIYRRSDIESWIEGRRGASSSLNPADWAAQSPRRLSPLCRSLVKALSACASRRGVSTGEPFDVSNDELLKEIRDAGGNPRSYCCTRGRLRTEGLIDFVPRRNKKGQFVGTSTYTLLSPKEVK